MFQATPETKAKPSTPAPTPAILLGLPTRGTISVETFNALQAYHDGFRMAPITSARLPVDQARNFIAAQMVAVAKIKPSEDWLALWVDADAWWPPKTVAQVVAILQARPDIDLLAASFSTRLPFSPRVAFRKAGDPDSFPQPGLDCEMGDLVEVERVGFHFVAHRVSLLTRLGSEPFATGWNGFSEDSAFCKRVRDVGGKIFCAPGLLVAHVDPNDGAAYLPGEPALRVENNRLVRTGFTHMAPKNGEVRDYGIATS